jgi:hypothetical protein
MKMATTGGPVRSVLMCKGLARYFRNAINALSKCGSPKHIINTDGSGVIARHVKGKNRKVALPLSCQTNCVLKTSEMLSMSLVASVSLGLNSLPLPFLTVFDMAFKDAELLLTAR